MLQRVFAIVSLAALTAACGGTAAPTAPARPAAGASQAASVPSAPKALRKVTLRLDYYIQGKDAPFYLARERGYYKDKGIDLDIQEGKGSLSSIQLVAAGNETFANADGAAMIQAAAKGAPVKAVASFIQKNPAGIHYQAKETIDKPTDLYGKTIAGSASGGAEQTLLPAFIAVNKLDASRIHMQYVDPNTKVGLLLDKKVDGVISVLMEGSRYNDKGTPVKFLLFSDWGVAAPNLSIVVNDATLQKDPQLVRNFLAATVHGFQDAQQDPQAGADVLHKYFPTVASKDFLEQLTPTFDLLHTARTTGKPLGWMASQDWADATAMLEKYAHVTGAKPAEQLISNDYLPQS